KGLIFTIAFICVFASIQAQDVLGKWKTVDDETGKVKSVVEIYERDNKLYGKIVKLFREPGQNPDPVCDECPEDDPRYNKKIIGMEIIKGLEKEGTEYANGTVLKPDEGRIYKCKIWLEDGNLKIRGYWGLFYRTQTWVKAG
ncbi:DUF2147 domain-containing protein, partial [Fulvivirga aurantia]|uniref:DUF2147 domain-containing protein n=1 Tax=Fulvivirga aurantia TaxID=2529383 RepID=UPI0012BB9949